MTRVLGTASAATAEDPFGAGDPLEVARLVRRALAAAGRRAVDVDGVVVVGDAAPEVAGLARFARRALGPHGADLPTVGHAGPAGHDERITLATAVARTLVRGGVGIGVAVGPGAAATAVCIGEDVPER